MENKKNYVDGVDVSECEYANACDKKLKCVILQDDVCEIDPYCEGCNCYYKQLQRLKAECEEHKAENERIKEENYQLQKDCQICENFIDFIPCKPIRDMDYDLQKVISQRDNYYQTLQEIRAKCQITDVFGAKDIRDILDKINKVIGAE